MISCGLLCNTTFAAFLVFQLVVALIFWVYHLLDIVSIGMDWSRITRVNNVVCLLRARQPLLNTAFFCNVYTILILVLIL